MISLESALKTLKKYGYSSQNVHPYLYKINKEVGVNYSYIDSKYGITERVVSFHNTADLDSFLKKYQWYKLNGRKEGVTLKLNNYEVANPEVLYIRNNHVMSDDEMFNMAAYDKTEEKNKRLSHTKRLLLEAEDLMEHYYLEKEGKEKYTNNLYNKEKELKRYYLDLQNLIDRYNKNNSHLQMDDEKKEFSCDLENESKINSKLVEYKNKLPKDIDIKNLINNIWELNKNLEINNNYMYALRYNDDIDEEMRLVVTKIDFMKELLSKKHPKLVNLKKKFENMDKQSTYESIYDDNFDNKFKDFINKKYSVINEINEFRLCEYLNNFKTNNEYDIEKNVERCHNDKVEKVEDFETSIEDINKNLKRQFDNNLEDKERNALILYSSLYKELFDMVQNIDNFDKLDISELISLLSITENFTSVYDECFTKVKDLLQEDVNKKIKNTIFKNINFESKEEFIKSIVKNIKIIANINEKIVLKNNVKLYFSCYDLDALDKNSFITTSSIIAPYMVYKSGSYKVIIANVKKGINVLLSPLTIVLPNINAYNKAIEIEDVENPEIIIDTRDAKIDKDKNTTVYSRFKANIVKNKNYAYVDKFDVNYKININKVIIEKRK